jgi:hypothetical protein
MTRANSQDPGPLAAKRLIALCAEFAWAYVRVNAIAPSVVMF